MYIYPFFSCGSLFWPADGARVSPCSVHLLKGSSVWIPAGCQSKCRPELMLSATAAAEVKVTGFWLSCPPHFGYTGPIKVSTSLFHAQGLLKTFREKCASITVCWSVTCIEENEASCKENSTKQWKNVYMIILIIYLCCFNIANKTLHFRL